MAYVVETDKTAIIDALQDLVVSRWSKAEAEGVCRFIAAYYQGTAATDLAERQYDDLYGAAISHWQLLRRQDEPFPRIHVYNPNIEQHGWESTHTTVQIVSPDMPFLVDSVNMALTRLGLTVHLIVHPVICLGHDKEGSPLAVAGSDSRDGKLYACMHFEVDRQTETQMLARISHELREVLADVERSVHDWQSMREQLKNALAGLKRTPPPIPNEELKEIEAFLKWVVNDHFTFLGYRRYDLKNSGKEPRLERVADTGLGILQTSSPKKDSAGFSVLPSKVQQEASRPEVLLLTKSSSRSTVHRPGYMDYIGIKRFNQKGEVIGEHRFLGLYTSAAYNRSPREIPLLRRKIDYVLEKARVPHSSHAGKALVNILETYPRDELIQTNPEQLHDIAVGILHLQERQRVRLFVRYDTFQRFVSCLVYAPRERYTTEVRQQMQTILEEAFGGEHSEFNIKLSESVLARIHIIVRLGRPGYPDYDHQALEAQLARTMRSWSDDYYQALLEHFGEEQGTRFFHEYGDAFNAAYREETPARTAALDTERLDRLDGGGLAISLYQPLEAEPEQFRFKLYHCGRAITLSDVLPMLENMGVEVIDEHPYDIEPRLKAKRWIHDFGLRYDSDRDTEQVREIFQDTFSAVWHGHVESDGFNRLVLAAGLTWREVVVLRAYWKYLRQAGSTFSQNYIEETLAGYPHITRLLVQLFSARFDPTVANRERARELAEAIEVALDDVPSLDEDRILRRYLAAIQATLRTNFYRQGADEPRPFLSFKLAPASIPEVPQPHPEFEVFVYSPRFEGVHLRGGKVARGGLRWSDRREDFRTEVLGLMKAQMVKNSVIVPVGAKGGFVLKQTPTDRDTLHNEVRDCYSNFIRGLLDITDNRVDGGIQPPPTSYGTTMTTLI
nr:NAD-glutamate dehydrogenase domain-containing protein [Alkalilimnicola ehrlichii]